MQASTIEMEPEVAKEKLEAYRRALVGRHSQSVEREWQAAMRGFEELAKGTPLVDPFQAIREAGWRADGRPVLAMARADQPQVQWSPFSDSRHWTAASGYQGKYAPMVWEFRARQSRWSSQRAASLTVRVEKIIVEPPVEPKTSVTLIPMVPPDVMPKRGVNLAKHFVLWEVESWDLAPPVDPMLLRPIGGNLYAVIAQWDLTELERAIIAGTRR